MTSSKQYADKDDAVTLTCAFTDDATITTTVTWYIDDSTTATTTGVEAGGTGVSLMKFASAAVADNAAYKCKVDFGGSYGSKTGTSLKQYVRSIDTKVTGTQYMLIGSALTHTCTIHGDILSKDVVWTNTAGALGATYTQDTQVYSASAYTTTSTLVISATVAADETSFICTVEYTQGKAAGSATIVQEILGRCSVKFGCTRCAYNVFLSLTVLICPITKHTV